MGECLRVEDFRDYCSGALDARQHARFEIHIASCERCRSSFDTFAQNPQLIAEVRRAAMSTDGLDPTLTTDETGAPPSTTCRIEIEGYRILSVLGQGGMGIVYDAIQEALNRRVALKVLPAVYGAASPDAVTRFRREATAAAKLHHTNIIPIYDFGESRDGYYFAMERIEGKPLDAAIRLLARIDPASAGVTRIVEILQGDGSDGPSIESPAGVRSESGTVRPAEQNLSARSSSGRGKVYFRQVARWIIDVADGLDYAHKEGIIHRDIKPSNLILSRQGRLMIGDFGLARSSEDRSVTLTGSLIGTLRYMSPEQAMAKRMHIDHRTDIYSLGATLYELLTFQPAFSGVDDKEILGQIITRDPAPPRELNRSVPNELETICLKSMEKDAAARYQTAGELAEDLRRYVNDLPIVAQRPGPLRRGIKFVRRRPAVTMAAVATSLLVVAAYVAKVQVDKRHIADAERMKKEVESLVQQGQVHATRGEWDTADAFYLRALRKGPADKHALISRANLKINLYNQTHNPDDLELARRLAREATTADPDFHYAWNTLGVILKKLGRYDEATTAYDAAIKLKPSYPAGWINKGTAQALEGDLAASEATLEHAVELVAESSTRRPEFVDAWRNLAAVQIHLTRPQALATMEEALRYNRDDPATWVLQAHLFLTLDGLRDDKRALTSAIAADSRDPEDPKALRVFALAHLRNDHNSDAIEYAAAALQNDDLPAINHLIRAVALARRGNDDDARTDLERALSTWPKDIERKGDYVASAERGVLWFDTADALLELRDEARRLLVEADPP